MLPRAFRLRREQDLKRVQTRGVAIHGALLTLRFLPSRHVGPRVAFTVSQRVSKRATERNTLKRRLREIVRSNLPSLKTHADLVLAARPGAHRARFAELHAEVERLFHRAHIQKIRQ